jgi:hypothetical protein
MKLNTLQNEQAAPAPRKCRGGDDGQIRMKVCLLHVAALVLSIFLLAGLASPLYAGLRDIHPRPQQMGYLTADPVLLAGTPFLVIPDNPTPAELTVRDEAVRLISARVNRSPQTLTASSYISQSPCIWMGTLSRFPALAAALAAQNIGGLGTTTHNEEYQLVVEDSRILLGASDLRGLRWGLQSLVQIMADMMGQLSVDRVYIRDWPALSKRVATCNSALRVQDQADYANLVVDNAYTARMNEIEWNGNDAGNPVILLRPFMLAQSNALAAKIRTHGQFLTMSCDGTGKVIDSMCWQEGVPVSDMIMRVQNGTFNVEPDAFDITVQNNSMESWQGNQPNNWTLVNPDLNNHIFRDNSVRHSGNSSVRYSNLQASDDHTELQQTVYVGRGRLLKLRYWYKLSGYQGDMNMYAVSPGPPWNRWEERQISYTTPTTQDWTLYEVDFRTFIADSCVIQVGPRFCSQGTAWVDDVSLEQTGPQWMLRRSDTPLTVTRASDGLLLREGTDFRVVETYSSSYYQFVRQPRFDVLSGGRLANGDIVQLNWYAGMPYQGENGKYIPCFTLLEPLRSYQDRVALMDSLMHPDGFKIHINEVICADYDPVCTARHLTPGQLVGRYCAQMYNIIQARAPGAPVRIYGDAVDVFAGGSSWAMPVSVFPWNTGALQELPAPVEVMAMTGYTSDLDSSLIYYAANNHPGITACGLGDAISWAVNCAVVARRQPNCTGFMYWMWDDFGRDEITARMMIAGDLAWNIGPFILHHPLSSSAVRPDSLQVFADMWSDTFRVTPDPYLTEATLHYRLLPGGTWRTTPLANQGRDTYAAAIHNIGGSAASVEYYLTCTDHREQTSAAPADAPAHVFSVTLPAAASGGGNPHEGDRIEFSSTEVSGNRMLAWTSKAGIKWYEVHYGTPDFSPESRSLLTRQSPETPRYFISQADAKKIVMDSLSVYAIPEEEVKPAKATQVSRR